MQRQILKASNLQNVCIFCTTRLQLAPTDTRAYPQRRLLHSTRSTQQTPAFATAEQEDESSGAPVRHVPREPPRFEGGWAKTTLSNTLTPEEERLKQAMQKTAPRVVDTVPNDQRKTQPVDRFLTSRRDPRLKDTAPNDRRKTQPVDKFSMSPRDPRLKDAPRFTDHWTPARPQDWNCASCGHRNGSSSNECRQCHKPSLSSKRSPRIVASPSITQIGNLSSNNASTTSPNQELQNSKLPSTTPRDRLLDDHIAATRAAQVKISQGWMCAACGLENKTNHTICQKCSEPAPGQRQPPQLSGSGRTGSSGPDVAQSWKHVRRRSDVSATAAIGTETRTAQQTPNRAKATSDISKDAAESKLDKERLARLERTKDGRYIGLNARRTASNGFSHDSLRNNSSRQGEERTFEEPRPRYENIQKHTDSPIPESMPIKLQGSRNKQSSDRAPSEPERLPLGPRSSTSNWKRWSPSPNHNTSAQSAVGIDAKVRAESLSSATDRAPLKSAWKSWTPTPDEDRRVERSTSIGHKDEVEDLPRSTDREPRTSAWKAWRPSSAMNTPATSFAQSDHSAEAENLSSATDREAKSMSDRISYIPASPSQEFDSSRIDKPKRKARREREPTKELDLTPRSFTVDASPYPKGGSRQRARRKPAFSEDFEEDEDDRAIAKIERRQQRKKDKAMQKRIAPPTPIYLPDFISVSNLAAVLRVKVEDFVSRMQVLGFEDTSNDHVLDAEVAGLIAAEFNFEPVVENRVSEDLKARPPSVDKSLLPPRPPVVTIMGHVDHGKTTLLDWLRKSSVAASEHGGITQHIGAFSVPMPSGKIITFLDTPGHAAFLSMRQRGANVTDIVILVVAADDSVKPQTIEAIKHAEAAKVPIIVAVNKIDKGDSNVDRVKQDLARHGVEIEDYGGDTQVVCVSGKTGQGMEELEDAAVALADILDMRAEIDGQAEGWILEATTKKSGRLATVLVRRGTIKNGDVIVAGSTWARVRNLKNEAGIEVPSAGPGTPVEVDGWREQPSAGDEVLQAVDEQQAKSVVEYRLEELERSQMALDMNAVNEARRIEQEKREQEKFEQEKEGREETDHESTATPAKESQSGINEVFFIIKGDVSGSVEAVVNNVSALGNSEVRPNILRSGVGPVAEFDVEHAAAAKGHIVSFNTPVDANIYRMAEAAGVAILDQNIIYRLVDDVKAKLSEKLPPLVTSRVLGEAEVVQVFEINTTGRISVPVAGCKVKNGIINRNGKVRVMRGKEVVYDGTLSSLKNVKKDVTEMHKGNECGMGFGKWTDFTIGDQIQNYEEKVEKRFL